MSSLARVRIALARDEPGHALDDVVRLLDRLLQQAEAAARMHSVIPVLLMRALAMQARGEHGAALVDLERALAIAAPEGYIRMFVDEGAPMAALLRVVQTREIMMSIEYVITIQGHLDAHWSAWFEGLTITNRSNGEATLTGPVVAQAALHSVLVKIRDLGLPLVAVAPVDATVDGATSLQLDEGPGMKSETDG